MNKTKIAQNVPAQSPSPVTGKDARGKMQPLIDKGRAFLLGYDLFISYRRSDANSYALRLANQLIKLGFRCYLDQFSSTADRNLPEAVKYALRHSTGMVIIGSPGALESKAIAEEVSIFSKLSRPMLPINVNGSLNDESWDGLIAGISRTEETMDALEKGRPSRQVLARLNDSANFRRRNERLKRFFFSLLAAIIIVILGGVGASGYYVRQAINARTLAKQAEESLKMAMAEAKAANDQRIAAEALLKTAEENLGGAEWLLAGAEITTDRAEAGAKRAQEQEQIARARAEEQTRIAEHQRRVAVSQELAGQAISQLNTNPETSVLAASDAYTVNPNDQTASILRRSLLASHVRSVITDDEANRNAPVFDAEGKYAATFNMTTGKVKVWDAVTGALLATLTTDDKPETVDQSWKLFTLAFSPDGKYIVGAGRNEQAYLWAWQDSSSGKAPMVLDGRKAAAGFRDENCNPPTGACGISRVSFSHDSRFVALGSNRGSILVWDITGNTSKLLLKHDKAITDLKFSPNGYYLMSAGADNQLLRWDLSRPDAENYPFLFQNVTSSLPNYAGSSAGTPTAPSLYSINAISYDDSGAYVITIINPLNGPSSGVGCGECHAVAVYESETGRARARLTGHTNGISEASFSHDEKSRYVITASTDGTVRIWNWSDEKRGNEPVILRDQDGAVHSASFSHDGEYIATGGEDGIVRFWRAGDALERLMSVEGPRTAQRIATSFLGHKGGVYVSFNRKGNHIITTGFDGTGRLWDASPMRIRTSFSEAADVTSAAFSPDGTHIVTIDNGNTVNLWEKVGADQFKPVAELKGKNIFKFHTASFSPNGKFVLAAGLRGDNTQVLQIWNWQTDAGQEKEPAFAIKDGDEQPVITAAFSHDKAGRYVLMTTGYMLGGKITSNVVRIWDRQNPEGEAPVAIIGPFAETVNSASFSFDAESRYVVVAGIMGVQVYDWKQDKSRPKYILAKPEPTSVAYANAVFSPDGKYVAAAYGASIRLWKWQTEEGRKLPLTMQLDRFNSFAVIETVDFNADSSLIVTNGRDNVTRLWDVFTGSHILSLGESGTPNTYKTSSSFGPDKSSILATNEREVRIYECPECQGGPGLPNLIRERVSPQALSAGPSSLLRQLETQANRSASRKQSSARRQKSTRRQP